MTPATNDPDDLANNGVSSPENVEGADDDRTEGSPHEGGEDATTDI